MKNRSKFLLLALSLFTAAVHPVSAQESSPEFSVKVDGQAITPRENAPVVSYSHVLEKATPAVVAVYTSRIDRGHSRSRQVPPGMEELFRHFGVPVPPGGRGNGRGEMEEPSERLERVGVGSGVIVSEDGYIVTNNHVIQLQRGQAADEIRVRLSNNREYVAELVGTDPKTDVAVLKIEAEAPLPSVTIADSDKLRVGDVVFAIGNPLDVGLTATQGIVSATGRNSYGILGPGAYEDFIQTDAAINLGNSGGALVDAWGRLVGINTAIVSGTGGNIGIGFAIPTNLALNVMTNLIETGEVPRGLLGLIPSNIDRDAADAFGLESTRGALVNQVQEGSPAEKGGIRHGDVIVQVDDVEIISAPQLRLVISQMAPGREVEVTVIRQGEEQILPVTLGSLSGTVSVDPRQGAQEQNIIKGIYLQPMDGEFREEFSVPEALSGVAVAEVSSDSPYAGGLAPGMVLMEVNGKPVSTPQEVDNFLRQGANRLYVWAGGQMAYVIIRINN